MRDREPTKSAARVAHDNWPAANSEQRIIRERVRQIIEKRDAEWRVILSRVEAAKLEQ